MAESRSKQIWNILYKDIVALEVLQLDGAKEDAIVGYNGLEEEETELEGANTEDPHIGWTHLDVHLSSTSN